VLRNIFEEEVAGGWRRLHNGELHNAYASPNTISAIKSRRMRWVNYVVRCDKREMHTIIWLENLKGRDHLEELGVDGKIIL